MSLSARAIALQGIGFGVALIALQGLAPVQDTAWDTSQGVAANLARNLSQQRSESAEARPARAVAHSGVNTPAIIGNSYAKPAPVRSYAGARVPITTSEITANAFTKPASTAISSSGFVAVWASANSYVRLSPTGGASGGGMARTRADGAATHAAAVAKTPAKARVYAQGVENPSDEEIVLLATMLTRSYSRGTNAPLYEITSRS